jgi:hypothetical protein
VRVGHECISVVNIESLMFYRSLDLVSSPAYFSSYQDYIGHLDATFPKVDPFRLSRVRGEGSYTVEAVREI